MTLKEAIEAVSFELGEVPYISNVALEAMDYLENHSDVVEPVRCRDCKNLIAFADGHHSCGLKPFDGGVYAMDYCSRGERRRQ